MEFIKKRTILPIVLALAVALYAWWAYANFMPHPLGDKMEYLSKNHSKSY